MAGYPVGHGYPGTGYFIWRIKVKKPWNILSEFRYRPNMMLDGYPVACRSDWQGGWAWYPWSKMATIQQKTYFWILVSQVKWPDIQLGMDIRESNIDWLKRNTLEYPFKNSISAGYPVTWRLGWKGLGMGIRGRVGEVLRGKKMDSLFIEGNPVKS